MCFHNLLLCLVMSDSSQTVVPASVSMEFCRQKYWIGLPFPLPGDLPNPGIEPSLLSLLCWQVDSLPLRHLLAKSKSDPITTLFRVFCYCCKKKKSAKNHLNNPFFLYLTKIRILLPLSKLSLFLLPVGENHSLGVTSLILIRKCA